VTDLRARVLVVDDDLVRLQTLQHALSADGYDVVTAPGGTLGLERLQAEDFSLVLTDLRMPDVSGLELLVEAREVAPQVPVLVFTAYGTSALEGAVRKLGAVNYLAGLWDLDVLLEMVRKAIGNLHDAKRRPEYESLEFGPATERWVGFVVAVARSKRDIATLSDWCDELGTSLGTLKRCCDACEVQASASLDFGRALRVAVLHSGQKCKWYDVLAIREPTTMASFLNKAGFRKDGIVSDVYECSRNQRFIRDTGLLKAALVTLTKAK
jgi:CheY-like chemotaxis protein